MIGANIPAELKQLHQWCVWKKVVREGKPTKAPFQPDGSPASATDPQTWCTYEAAIGAAVRFDGVGFIFSADDPYCGVDLDKCIEGGKQTEAANKLLKCLMSYSERSQSGEGIHIIVKANKPGERCKFNKLPGMKEMEVYDSGRFFIMTGNHITGTPRTVEERQELITVLYERALARQTAGSQPRQHTGSTVQTHHMTDDDVVQALCAARNGDRFKRLFYGGDTSDYGNDQSRADLALCAMIAFYTQDDEQIERIMRSSIMQRPKWDVNKRYLARTITRTLDTMQERYEGRRANA